MYNDIVAESETSYRALNYFGKTSYNGVGFYILWIASERQCKKQ